MARPQDADTVAGTPVFFLSLFSVCVCLPLLLLLRSFAHRTEYAGRFVGDGSIEQGCRASCRCWPVRCCNTAVAKPRVFSASRVTRMTSCCCGTSLTSPTTRYALPTCRSDCSCRGGPSASSVGLISGFGCSVSFVAVTGDGGGYARAVGSAEAMAARALRTPHPHRHLVRCPLPCVLEKSGFDG